MKKDETALPAEAAKAPAFTRDAILQAKRYRGRRDALAALLDEKKCYTHEQVEALLDGYLKRKVK